MTKKDSHPIVLERRKKRIMAPMSLFVSLRKRGKMYDFFRSLANRCIRRRSTVPV